jgi:hypothetical protein
MPGSSKSAALRPARWTARGRRAEWASELSGTLRGVRPAVRRAIVATAVSAARTIAIVSAAADPPGTWGPYYRIGSTQDDATTRNQLESEEVWGRANRGSDIPSVDAWVGPHPADRNGIEFYTDVEPSPDSPLVTVRSTARTCSRCGTSQAGAWLTT